MIKVDLRKKDNELLEEKLRNTMIELMTVKKEFQAYKLKFNNSEKSKQNMSIQTDFIE